jgi:hypothetical protein
MTRRNLKAYLFVYHAGDWHPRTFEVVARTFDEARETAQVTVASRRITPTTAA